MTTTANRFQVTCETCGFIDSYPSLVESKVRAISAHDGSHNDCGLIEIFDLMAHIGKPELYSYKGIPTVTRTS